MWIPRLLLGCPQLGLDVEQLDLKVAALRVPARKDYFKLFNIPFTMCINKQILSLALILIVEI